MDTLALTHAIGPYDVSSCIISKNDTIVYHYENIEGASSRLVPVNSCTKSILSALICIAMDKGMLPGPDTPIQHFFPQLLDDQDTRKAFITMEQLLTLTAGFSWTEFGGANSFPTMTRTPDWVQYTLAQPLSDAPGSKMVYNSGVSQLLAAILVQAANTSIAQFAERHLFSPLNIQQYEWKSDPQGIHTGGFGLQLCAYDMLKFGLLFLHKGKWKKERLISEAMVDLSTRAAIAVTPPEQGCYGWHWWVDCLPANALSYYYARGFGGQFIIIVPAAEAVIVLTRKPRKKGLSPLEYFRQHIAPLLIANL
ncbi:serine hydrolase domain-containing protein [Paenibacillus sp. IITD108]|uniref:serine hydrolase domain-containing protein n=1 Tax=Paenibacillus sp. IITD108 TaxID=3116649 RepID=UPI002F3F9589